MFIIMWIIKQILIFQKLNNIDTKSHPNTNNLRERMAFYGEKYV